MIEKKYTIDEIITHIEKCIEEMLKDNFFINYIKSSINLTQMELYDFDVSSANDILVYLFTKELGIPCSELKSNSIIDVDNLLDKYLVNDYSKEELETKKKKIETSYFDLKKHFYSQIKDIFQSDNKEFLKDLIDKQINIVNLSKECIFNYINIERENSFEIFGKEANGFIKYCDIDLLTHIIDLGMYDIITYISDEVFEQLSFEYIDKLIPSFGDSIFKFKQENKIKYLLENKYLIKLLSNCDNFETIKTIFTYVDNIDEDTFNIILEKNLYKGIEICKSVTSNEIYVKKLLENSYSSIIWGLEEHQFSGTLLEIMKKTGALKNAIQDRRDSYDILRSDYIFNIFVEVFDDNFFYNPLLKKTPRDSLTDEKILTCILNCNFSFNSISNPDIIKYENRTLDDIKYAIELGYKCSRKTYLKNIDEVKLFIENGQPEIINYVTKNIFIDTPILISAIEHGYKFDKNSPLEDFSYSTLPLCLKMKSYDAIIPYFLYKHYETQAIIQDYIDCNPTVSEDGTFKSFFENIGILDEFIDTIIMMPNKEIKFYNKENWIAYAMEKYKNNPIVLKYLENFNIPYYIKSVEDIKTYFDEFGPKEELYDIGLTDLELFRYLFSRDDWEKIYNPKEEIKQYIYAVKKVGVLFTQHIKTKEDVFKYFDAEGPKEEFYEIALTNRYLFKNLFVDKWQERYDPGDEIDKYILFTLKYGYILSAYIKTKEDIYKYFDAEGPKENLYDILLTEPGLFKHIFLNNYRVGKYEPSIEIKQYIDFTWANGFIFNEYIKSKEDIKKYFDEFGPKEELYDIALTNSNAFSSLFDSATNDWEKQYNPSEEIKRYIEFTKKYGLIFNRYIKYKSDIYKYFNAYGVSEEFKICLKDDSVRTKTLITSLAHNRKILHNISLEFVNVFEYYLIDTYFKELPKEKQKEKYDYLLKNVGPMLLFNFDEEKINKLINIDIEELDKIFLVLNSAKYKVIPNNIAYDNIVVPLVNFEFRKKYPDIANIFVDINSLLINMKTEEFENYISGEVTGDLSQKLNILCLEIINYLKLDEAGIKDFKGALIECKNFKEGKLRKYCRKFLKKKEKEYLKNRGEQILSDIGIPSKFNREDAINKLIVYLQNNISYEEFNSYRKKLIKSINYEELPQKYFIKELNMTKAEYDHILSITYSEFNSIISSIITSTKPDEDIKINFGIFKRFLKQCSVYKFDNEEINYELTQLGVSKENPIVLNQIDVIKVLSEVDIEVFLNTIGKDERLLKNISRHFEWNFIGRLPNQIYDFFTQYNVTLPGGINNIGGFINRYYNILLQRYNTLKSQGKNIELVDVRFFFTEIIETISRTNSETIEIKRLLGREEYNDFAANAPNNSANFSRIEREKKLVNILDFLYTLDKVTIPSKDIIISNNDDTKQINFIIGNRTNPSNICHGERTGACMRLGGVGEGLFLKCLTDKNWFHIRLEDPITHEYISRVSGFRNGNTVYLNQLRDSAKIDKYSNRDLQEFIEIYAKGLIEETKSSEYPVENVFINTEYAMQGYTMGSVQLGNDIQEEYNLNDVLKYRLRNSTDIWTDVGTSAYLLATTENDAKTAKGYVPIKNGPDSTELYDSVRDKIYGLKYEDNDIPKHQFVQINIYTLKDKINRVHGMKEKLLDKDYRYDIYDKIVYESEIVDGYASSDWYVYVDSSYELHYDFIQEINKDNLIPYNNASVAQTEMEKYKQILVNKYNLDVKKIL